MGIVQTALIALALFALLQWLVLPRLRRSISVPVPKNPVRSFIFLVVASVLRSACLIAAISLGAIALILLAIPAFGGRLDAEQLAVLFAKLASARERLLSLDAALSLFILVLLVMALWLSVRRDALRRWTAAVQAAVDKLNAAAQAGTLPTLPPSSEMTSAAAALAATLDEWTKVQEAAAAGDPVAGARAIALATQATSQREALTRLDLTRRLDIGSELAAGLRATPQGRFARILTSIGVYRGLSLVSRTLALASMLLLAPALVTLSGTEIGDRIAVVEVDLHRLVVAKSREEAEAGWRRRFPPPPQPRDLSEAEAADIDSLSNAYQTFARTHLAVPDSVVSDGANLARIAARRQVLSDFAASRAAAFEVRGGSSGNAGISELLAEPGTAVKDGPEARGFRERVTTLARSTPAEEWAKVSTRAKTFLTSASRPMTTAEIGRNLLAEVLNTGGAIALEPGPHATVLMDIASAYGKPGDFAEQARQLVDLDVLKFASNAAEIGEVPATAGEIRAGVPRFDANMQQWADGASERLTTILRESGYELVDRPPSLALISASDDAAAKAAQALLSNMPRASAAQILDTLARYEDFFPGFRGEELSTLRAAFAQSAGEAFASEAAKLTDNVAANFNRARNYVQLRGFAKIGGVLIGLDPAEGEGPNVVGLDWSQGDDGVTLMLTTEDGATRSYGPFRAAIIRQALAYAADGRAVAATMPLTAIGRQVLLHPALVDSTLGCDARLVDQFVDGSTAGADFRSEAVERVDDQLALYRLAWATRFRQLEQTLGSVDSEIQGFVDAVRQLAVKIQDEPTVAEAAARALADPLNWADARLSPITSKPAFFDAKVVDSINACIGGDGDLEGFTACVAAQPRADDYVASGEWIVPPPDLFAESGVRELEYSLDETLDFLDLDAVRDNRLWPFDFMLQVTFESPPYFKGDSGADYDPDPFEFPAIKDRINAEVASAVLDRGMLGPDAARAFAEIREFTVLQRFFRLAFNGRLGADFPVDRLVALGRVEPRSLQPDVRTPRWNVFAAEQYQQLLDDGAQPEQLKALGYEADYIDFLAGDGSCPAIAHSSSGHGRFGLLP